MAFSSIKITPNVKPAQEPTKNITSGISAMLFTVASKNGLNPLKKHIPARKEYRQIYIETKNFHGAV